MTSVPKTLGKSLRRRKPDAGQQLASPVGGLEDDVVVSAEDKEGNAEWKQLGCASGKVQDAILTGYLKKGAGNGKWGRSKQRFFVLLPSALLYYLREHRRWAGVRARGLLELGRDTSAALVEGRTRKFVLRGVVRQGQDYSVTLAAPSEQEAARWLAKLQETVHALRLPPRGPPMLRLAAPVDVPGPETMKQLYGVGGDDAAVTPTTLLPDSPRALAGGGTVTGSLDEQGLATARSGMSAINIFSARSVMTTNTMAGGESFMLTSVARTTGGSTRQLESRDSAGNLTHMDTMDLLFPSHTPTSPPMEEATMAGDGP